jgi:pimeloyl-ACP methyl ester carboxylesterase
MMTEQQLPASHHRALPGGESPLGRWYNVAGRRIWCYRAGAGSPAVVFLPGASAVGLDYLNLADQVSEFATAVLYDRGGTGWSDDAELPRPAADVATELHELLEVAGVPGPYLLVAHSLGGAYARRFAQLFPADVAGVVYLDAFSEDNDEYVPERLHLANLSQPDPGPLMLRLMRPIAGRM